LSSALPAVAPALMSVGGSVSKRRRAYLFLVLSALFWAGNFVFAEAAVRELSPLLLTFYRWGFAAPVLVVMAVMLERPDWRRALRQWKFHLLQSMLGIVFASFLCYEGLKVTSAINASLIQSINPVTIVLFAAVMFRTPPSARTWLGLIVSLIGVAVVLAGPELGRFSPEALNSGVMLLLATVLCWTLYSVLGRYDQSPPITSTAVQSSIAAAVMFPFAAVSGFAAPLTGAGYLQLAYIVIFPSVLALVLWNLAVRDIGPTKASVYLNLMPIFTVALAVAFGDRLEFPQIIGGCLVIAGVLVTSYAPINRRELLGAAADATADADAPPTGTPSHSRIAARADRTTRSGRSPRGRGASPHRVARRPWARRPE
jgi:drug/metabolite transporter (DMT)-like permease